ncbi:hypothetical protein D9M72_423220 [compost metagenome]
MAEQCRQLAQGLPITQASQGAGGAQADLPVVVLQSLHQRGTSLGQPDLAEGSGGFLADLPGGIPQRGIEGRQHTGVTGQAEGAGGGATDFGIRVIAGQAGQCRQCLGVPEPAEDAHCLAAHRRLAITQRQQRGTRRIFQSQLA